MTISGRLKLFLWRSVLVVMVSMMCISWGKYGHEHINHAVVLTLPPELRIFYYNHIDFITVEANLPDVRKYTMKDSAEFPRHHIHLEAYGKLADIPKGPKEIKAKYDAKFFAVHGILPWYIQEMMVKLTDAMKNKHKSDILLLSADLGHYIGDAYMPLHTSINHNGELTDQKGIHGLFEGRLPELFGDTYNYNVGDVHFIDDIQKETWRIVVTSNHTADTLLKADKDLTQAFGNKDKIFEMADGKIKTNMYKDYIYTTEYAKALNNKLNDMVERQLRGAISSTACYVYTAWINAGKPDLTDLDAPELTSRNAKDFEMELKLFKQGKLFGIKSEKEF